MAPCACAPSGVPTRWSASARRALVASECLIRFQLPGVAEGALGDAFDGFTETISLLNARP